MGATDTAMTGLSIYQFFKYGLTGAFILIFFINAIMMGLETKDATQTLKTLGSELVFVTQEIQSKSLDIINNGMYTPEDNFFSGIWKCIWTNALFFYYLYMVYLWLQLFMLGYAWSPLSNDSNKFINLLLAIVTFLLLQSFFLLIFSEPLEGQSKMDLALAPVYCFYDFFRAIPVIFSNIPLSLKDMSYTKPIEETINKSSSGLVVM